VERFFLRVGLVVWLARQLWQTYSRLSALPLLVSLYFCEPVLTVLSVVGWGRGF